MDPSESNPTPYSTPHDEQLKAFFDKRMPELDALALKVRNTTGQGPHHVLAVIDLATDLSDIYAKFGKWYELAVSKYREVG
ncbi:MAG: hypothetical protein WCI73_20800, partial [Phycisphaerae bacterium]